MRTIDSASALDRHLEQLANRFSSRLARVDGAVVATRRTFAPMLPVSKRRVDAYFAACVRRACLRAGGEDSARLVLAAVVSDLNRAGRSAEDIWDELRRGWSNTMPVGVLEEYRLMLGCAA